MAVWYNIVYKKKKEYEVKTELERSAESTEAIELAEPWVQQSHQIK